MEEWTPEQVRGDEDRTMMNRSRHLAAIALAFALAACGSGAESQGNTTAVDNAFIANTAIGVPDNAVTPEASEVLPHATPPGEPATADAIPAAFRGRWSLVPDDCDPARDDAKGLMVIDADSLTFYESRGVPTHIAVLTPDKIMLDLDFTGEGQTWTRTTTFTLLADGKTLVREETDPITALRYHRCNA
jgi:hypothetical protein